MKVLSTALLLAGAIALAIAGLTTPRSLDAQLMHLQLEQSLPGDREAWEPESPEVQALLLAYSEDRVLVTKASLALMRYPTLARPVFQIYGEDLDFQEVLSRYGEDVVLPIHYFMTHEVFTLDLMRSVNETARAFSDALRAWRQGEADEGGAGPGPMTTEERGGYAIQFLAREGYGFLRQFVVSSEGDVQWVQTDRVLESLNRFFAGGIADMERKYRRNEALSATDLGWAAVDVVVGVSALKLLRMGRTASAGKSLTLSQRSAAVGAGLWRGSVIGMRAAKIGAPAVLAYIAVRHPSVINSLLVEAADALGVPVPLALWLGWTLVLLPVMLLLRWLMRPVAWLLAGVLRLLRHFEPARA